jgi:gliding motility-associated-like protein
LTITVFKGSAIYVPTGFTPDDNGLNDVLQPRYIGIKKLQYFTVYNRWGQAVFSTSDMGKAWNGSIKGEKQATAVYIWQVHAIDYAGKVYELRGTTTLIR